MHSLATILLFVQGGIAWKLPHSALGNFEAPHGNQIPVSLIDDDETNPFGASSFAGLRTFANLPFIDCFSDQSTKDHKYDIAVFGAPHDTVSTVVLTPRTTTGRPGARFGPPAIRTGSQRKSLGQWSVYTGMPLLGNEHVASLPPNSYQNRSRPIAKLGNCGRLRGCQTHVAGQYSVFEET
ncbi:putative agmatinase 1 [Colletotrichum spaethianum]|uniref:Agmatinase 1 n=1 Tax=Colletotrichum spaethianum TaxID=700344 RepID=A0AA37L3S6_9PEZI|nr:putative agmatinase 1 [Colletotrichum spaethianum]GKT41456.1 putative agmatinase 1 [Colletotrichum spaethianum]